MDTHGSTAGVWQRALHTCQDRLAKEEAAQREEDIAGDNTLQPRS